MLSFHQYFLNVEPIKTFLKIIFQKIYSRFKNNVLTVTEVKEVIMVKALGNLWMQIQNPDDDSTRLIRNNGTVFITLD